MMKPGERPFPKEEIKVTKSTILNENGATFFQTGLVADFGFLELLAGPLGLDKDIDDPDESLSGWFDEGMPFGYDKFYFGTKQRLLAKDKESGRMEFRDAMQACKEFCENNNKEEFNASDKRPVLGSFTVPAFSLSGGGVLLFSPHYIPPAMKDELDAMGGVRAAFLPTPFHNMFLTELKTLYPDCLLLGPACCASVAAAATAAAAAAATAAATAQAGTEVGGEQGVTATPTTPLAQQKFFDVEDEDHMSNPQLRAVLDSSGLEPVPMDGLHGSCSAKNGGTGGAAEFALLHRPSGVLATSDVLYGLGPGAPFMGPGVWAPEWGFLGKLYDEVHLRPALKATPGKAMPAAYRVMMIAAACQGPKREGQGGGQGEGGAEGDGEGAGVAVEGEEPLVSKGIRATLKRLWELLAEGAVRHVHGCHVPMVVTGKEGIQLIEDHWGWAVGPACNIHRVWERVASAAHGQLS